MRTLSVSAFSRSLIALVALVAAQACLAARAEGPLRCAAGLHLPEIPLHDPCILPEASTHTYYLYTSAPASLNASGHPGTFVYRSQDLATWEGPFVVFEVPEDSWASAAEMPWAPEVHAYQGKYYLFTTLHNSARKLTTPTPGLPNSMRSTMIAMADSPMGPFRLLKKESPVAPSEFMTLDGTLYVDPAGRPWMVYAHEWLQKVDGTIEALPLKQDLSEAAGAPIHLFKGSDAPWINAQRVPDAKPLQYVTDGPQLFRTKTGALLMLWSSYTKNAAGRDDYVETLARSRSGELKGPWEQLQVLVGNDSGHGMLFRTFEGQLMLVVHQPFRNARGKIYEMEDLGNDLSVVSYREDLSGPPLAVQQGQEPR